jgi:hypothetical protein
MDFPAQKSDTSQRPASSAAALVSHADKPLAPLQTALDALRRGESRVAAFSALAQAQSAVLAALPPRYATVLMQLLTSLESSALFTEESCSFSQVDLLDKLQMWLDKAAAELEKA